MAWAPVIWLMCLHHGLHVCKVAITSVVYLTYLSSNLFSSLADFNFQWFLHYPLSIKIKLKLRRFRSIWGHIKTSGKWKATEVLSHQTLQTASFRRVLKSQYFACTKRDWLTPMSLLLTRKGLYTWAICLFHDWTTRKEPRNPQMFPSCVVLPSILF